MKLFRENLSENVLLDRNSAFIDLFELDMEDPTIRLKQILRDYFDIPISDSSRSKERRVLFLHSTFKEYLMAETYIEILMVSKNVDILNPSWMNVAIPTNESMLLGPYI